MPISQQNSYQQTYSVTLYVCPAVMPFSFATHPWFEVRIGDKISRWEVSMFKRDRELSFGHLNKDLLPCRQGIPVFPFLSKPFWGSRQVSAIEGGEGSLAAHMAAFIEASAEKYSLKDTYSLVHQNSNTYVQWVLNEFPEAEMKLPWNAIGKKQKTT